MPGQILSSSPDLVSGNVCASSATSTVVDSHRYAIGFDCSFTRALPDISALSGVLRRKFRFRTTEQIRTPTPSGGTPPRTSSSTSRSCRPGLWRLSTVIRLDQVSKTVFNSGLAHDNSPFQGFLGYPAFFEYSFPEISRLIKIEIWEPIPRQI